MFPVLRLQKKPNERGLFGGVLDQALDSGRRVGRRIVSLGAIFSEALYFRPRIRFRRAWAMLILLWVVLSAVVGVAATTRGRRLSFQQDVAVPIRYRQLSAMRRSRAVLTKAA